MLSVRSRPSSEHSATKTEVDALKQINKARIPAHVAIIMDGNGRWAKQRHLPRVFGHRAGITSVREIVRAAGELGIQFLTLYAFSSENWSRPTTEVKALMKLLEQYLVRELPELQKNNVRLRGIGRLEALPQGAQDQLKRSIEATAHNTGLTLNLALNYGGRQEIIDACNRALRDKLRKIDEATFKDYLDTADCPDPDLMIRTSGEMRVSNFLLWQIAYTEFYMTTVPWPEFRRIHLYRAIIDYQRRDRRFGGV